MQGKLPIKKTALLHFLPLELYPPVMNFINCLAKKNADSLSVLNIYSTPCTVKELVQYNVLANNIRIKRFGMRHTSKSFINRMLHYFLYYTKTLLQLVVSRPGTVLYYDTISSFPAWCYKTFFNRSCRMFIHYHEYMSKEEYSRGMVLLKWFHKLEMHLYEKAEWVSHTNKERMQLFLEDMPEIIIKKNTYILPNYPPQSWQVEKKTPVRFPVRFIQVGSLGMDTMYTKEFAEWIIQQNGKATWDIYALTIEEKAMDYITYLKSSLINFKGKVNYEELPAILKQYDAGVILYKGHIPNYIYNAPNKMFEYYMCGLDTWFPQQMVTACHYTTINTFPKIIPVIFDKLSLYVLDELVKREGLEYRQHNYTAEQALSEIIKELGKNTAN